MLPSAELLGASLVAVATVAGAWLARRHLWQRWIWFAAAGALLIVACLHLVPNSWAAARDASAWPPLVPIAAVAACCLRSSKTRPLALFEDRPPDDDQQAAAQPAVARASHHYHCGGRRDHGVGCARRRLTARALTRQGSRQARCTKISSARTPPCLSPCGT